MSAPLSRKNLPENPTPDDILNAFLDYLTATGTEPYDHQEEAILELFACNNVILNTPTGSGKSLVALQFKSLCQGRRSYYTVPIKALANEKLLSLCHVLGPEKEPCRLKLASSAKTVGDQRFAFGTDDKEQFRIYMRMMENFSGCRVLAYCLMCNHFHILLEVPPRFYG
jgi:superfamily II DNA or RNA helicase